jgi:PAS domain S-box-containing protein
MTSKRERTPKPAARPTHLASDAGAANLPELAAPAAERTRELERELAEYKRAAEAWRASEARYRRLADKARDIIFRYDLVPEMRLTYINPVVEEITGYSPEECYADPYLMLNMAHPEDRQIMVSFLGSLTAPNKPFAMRWIGKDGVVRWMESRVVPVYDAAGQLTAVEGITRDMTERRQVEEALRESEEKYRLLVENLNDMAYILDTAGRFTYISPAIERISGYKVADLIGRHFTDFIHPDDLPRLLESYGRTLRGEIEPLEYRIFDRDGSVRHIRTSSQLIYRGDAVIGMSGVLTDVTARAHVEEQLQRQNRLQQLLLKLSSEFINLPLEQIDAAIQAALQEMGAFVSADRVYVFDYDFSSNTCSNTFEWCAPGITPQIAALQRVPLEGIPEWVDTHRRGAEMIILDVGALPPGPLREILEAQEIKSLLMLPMIAKEGLLGFAGFDSVARYRVYSDEEIVLLRLFCQMLVNITVRKRAEDRLRATLADLQRSNADLEQFAYIASHDLQEPLRMITSYVQLLGMRYRGQLDADADDFIGFAMDGAMRMQQLILDLLEYSRVGTRGAPLQPTDATRACQAAIQDLEVAIAESAAAVVCDPLPTVLADASQLRQLFQNLIGNAIKFRGAEPPRVRVSALQVADSASGSEISSLQSPISNPKSAWLFAVRDNGIGIEPQYFERIFAIFQRLHNRSEYPGTGVGLAVCKKIVERHGGRIWVESTAGQGSTFFFTLPCADSPGA